VTLRGLERDGIVTRTVYSAMPPNIAYRLTKMGATLWEATAPLLEWANLHLPAIEVARNAYDSRVRGDVEITVSAANARVRPTRHPLALVAVSKKLSR